MISVRIPKSLIPSLEGQDIILRIGPRRYRVHSTQDHGESFVAQLTHLEVDD